MNTEEHCSNDKATLLILCSKLVVVSFNKEEVKDEEKRSQVSPPWEIQPITIPRPSEFCFA